MVHLNATRPRCLPSRARERATHGACRGAAASRRRLRDHVARRVLLPARRYVQKDLPAHEKVRESFGEMGVSVFSGMLTSIVASLPLFLCTITFFAKFGQFLCLTISFSWVFANFFFMSLLATFGGSPEEFAKIRAGGADAAPVDAKVDQTKPAFGTDGSA